MKVAEEALKFLNLGIESELAAYVFYRRSSKMIDDEGVSVPRCGPPTRTSCPGTACPISTK
jgi:hypothetical protein